MARRRRIRHKLMLGLATAIAILVLFLAATLRGLWSYHVTMKLMQSKLEEREGAQPVKDSIAALTAKKIPSQFDLEDFVEVSRTRIGLINEKLHDYEVIFQKTLQRELTNDDGAQIAGILNEIRGMLDQLQIICTIPLEEMSKPVQVHNESERFTERRNRLAAKLDKLRIASDDLLTEINKNLGMLIGKSRDNYFYTLCMLIVICVVGLILMICAQRFFYSWILDPVQDLQESVSRLAEGNFEHRIEVNSGDEMEELASAFNDMTSRLHDLYRDMATQINERSRQLVRSERLASVGFLAAGVAHEINNPLASIAFCSEALEARLDQLDAESGGQEMGVFTKYLRMIQEEAFRCKKITERLLEVSRNSENKRERTDLAALVQSVLEVTQHHPKSKDKEIIFAPAGPVYAWACVEEIKSVVINLLFNSLESMDEGGTLTIELRQRDGMAEVLFRDTGCGMTQEVLENIFEPFFTRSRSGKGTGLGLTITHKIVSQHGGEIEADSPGVDQGSTFRVRLPMQPTEASREEPLGHNAAA